jgi:hypothetical protein
MSNMEIWVTIQESNRTIWLSLFRAFCLLGNIEYTLVILTISGLLVKSPFPTSFISASLPPQVDSVEIKGIELTIQFDMAVSEID